MSSPAPATPGVFSLDRLRLSSTSGPEDYLYTAGNAIYPEGGIDAGANYYKVVVTDTAGTVRNPGFPCTSGANFATTNNSYTVGTSDPVSNSIHWKFTLQQFSNASCTGTPAKSAFLQFDVAKLTSWADPALTTQKSAFAPGQSVYVQIAGLKPSASNVSNTWILPSGSTACANNAGGDRPNIDGFGRLPSTAPSGYLLFPPVPGTGGSQWNRALSYDIGPCPALSTSNEGQWTLRIDVTPTLFVTVPAFSVDATPPPIPSITSGPPSLSNSPSGQFAFSDTEQGATFRCQLDGGTLAACTSPFAFSGLADGAHTFQVRARDAAGNESSPASASWTIDRTPPDTNIDSGPSGTVNSTNASFDFSSEAGATLECDLDGGGFSACTSPKAYSGLGEGAHTFRVRARDAAGNLDPTPATRTWTVDTVAPPTPSIDSGPPDPSGSADASFTFSDTESGVSFRCQLDGGGYTACASPRAYSGLSEGPHTFQVVAVDAASNTSTAASRSWTIDLAPVITLITPADGSSTNDSTPTFSGTASTGIGDSTTITVKVYAGTVPGGTPVETLTTERDTFGNWSVDASPPLADGTFTGQAEQSNLDDVVGHSNANTFVLDTVAPPAPLMTSGPSDPSNSNSGQFTFSDSEQGATFRCQLDGGALATCTSPYAFSGLADGAHTFQVRARDAAGNESSPTSASWTIDTTPPETTIGSGPSGTVNSTNASFGFSSEAGATFECKLDGAAFAACTSPKAYSGLSEGAHTFQVRAHDTAGNIDPSPAARTWTVDTTPPDTTIDSGPSGTVDTASATFSFSSEAGTSFQCNLDGGGFAACASPKSYGGLSDGAHTFQVRAVDGVGNVDPTPATRSWTVDTTPPPAPSIDSGPPDPSGSTSASFNFSDSESGVTFRCRLDGGGFSACVSPKSYSGLTEATHTFEVRAVDGVSNESSGTTRSWTIDVPPLVTLTTPADGSSTNDTTPTFSGTAGTALGDSTTVTVRVYLGTDTNGPLVETVTTSRDSFGNWSVDASPPLASGTFTAQARQTDLGGNVGLSSPNTFVVTQGDITPPDITLSSPADGALTNDASPTFSGTAGTAPGDLSAVTVKVYSGSDTGGTLVEALSTTADVNGAFAVDASPALADGTYTAQGEQHDGSGNIGRSAAHTFTVDTTPPGSTIDSGPSGLVATSDAMFTFSSEAGASFECKLDGAGFAACASPKVYSGLSEGAHSFQVQARDLAGNLDPTPATRSWTVDTVAPPIPSIDSRPPDISGSSSTSFTFSDSESGVSFRCRLDNGSFATCTSPKAYSGLSEGSHTFEVFALDGAGNFSGEAFDTWTVDTTSPVVTLTSPVNGSTTGDATPPYSGIAGTASGDSTTVTVKVYAGTSPTGTPLQTLTATAGDGGAFSVETSQGLTKGTFTARAEQTDAAAHTGFSSPTTFTVSAPAYRREVLADNPRGYWRLGETSGTTAADETAANPGTYVNGVTLGQPGALSTTVNTAALFDGVNDYVTMPNSTSLNATSGVTVEAWAKHNTGSAVWQVVVSKPGDGQSKNENYSIWFNYQDKPIAFFGDGTSYARVDGPVLDANWHYLVATYDNATARIYVDGTLRASTASTVRLTANSLPLNIGRSNTNTFFYRGQIDDVAVYGTVLSAARIQGHYTAATTFDSTAPAVTLTAPTNGLRTDDTTPTFSGTAGTAGGDSTTVTVKVYAGSTATGTPIQTLAATRNGAGAYSVDASPALPEGTYTARVEQTDDAGNIGFSSANTFIVTFGDTTPPVVTLTSPPNGSITTDRTPTFGGVGGNAQGDSATVTVKIYVGSTISGTPVQTLTATRDGGTGAYSVDSAFLDASTYTARAEQYDTAGNVGLSQPTTFTIPSDYRAAVMADNPRAYWRLGELPGSTAADQTGVNPGTFNFVTLGRSSALTGDRDTTTSFDGVSSYVIAPDSNSLDASTGASVEAWVKRTKGGVWQQVVGKPGDGQSKNENYALWISPLDKAVAFFGDGTNFVRIDDTAPLDTDWHYIVATYDNATAKIYRDGVLDASLASTVRLTPNIFPLNVGRSNAGAYFYGGLVDEVAVYGTALTVSQIDAHFNAANLYDTTPPVVTLTTPDQDTSTKDTTPLFAGMAATTSRDSATITVKLYAGSTPTGTPIQTLSASRFPTGAWDVSASTPVPDGTYTAQAQQLDTAANVGLSAAKTFTVVSNPPPTTDPVMVGAGDIGDCETQSDNNVGLLLDSFPNAVVFTTGDNAYPNGTVDQFNNCLDPAWGQAKARIRPAIGGHEYQTAQAAGYFTYYANNLAPFGSTATDYTKAYYSYDLGTWHVIVLNTECIGLAFCSVPGELAWAGADLDAHPAACTLAIMPNPRYSSGDVHGNNASIQPFWDLLNQKGIDLAISSDDHIYERYAPQNAMGAYDPAHGVREFIVGTGGSSHYSLGIRRENSEIEDHHTFGLLKLTLHNGSYEWEFVPAEGATFTDSGSAACH